MQLKSQEYQLKSETQAFESKTLNSVISMPLVRNKEAFLQEQLRISRESNIPLPFRYKDVERDFVKPVLLSKDPNYVTNSANSGETSKPVKSATQPQDASKDVGMHS